MSLTIRTTGRLISSPCFHNSVPGRDSNYSSHCVAPSRSSMSALSFYCSRSSHLTYDITSFILILKIKKSLPPHAIMQETTGCSPSRYHSCWLPSCSFKRTTRCFRTSGSLEAAWKPPQLLSAILVITVLPTTAHSRRQPVTMYFGPIIGLRILPGSHRVPSFRFQVSFRFPSTALHQPAAL